MSLLTRWRGKLFRTWPVAAAALGGLLLLIYTSVASTSRKAEAIYTQLDQLNSRHREVESKLRRLRSDVQISGIYIRDYLLDADSSNIGAYRRQLTELRQNNAVVVGQLRVLLPRAEAPRIDNLQKRLDDYWSTFDPLFEWSLYEKMVRSTRFLKREVIPRRDAVLAITTDIEQLNNTNLSAQRAEVARRLAEFRDDLHSALWHTLLLGLIVAIIAVLRLRALERHSDRQRVLAEGAEQEMRLLSQQLVAAHEEERKKLTRELHDHVGQMLTALRMEIGRADRARGKSESQVAQSLAEARRLLDTILRSVRDLAMGLRPSMLDDFGLQPALDWHVREFRRRFNIPVELTMSGDFDSLLDPYRTSVYRIVQEALTNCARHAHAQRVDVSIALQDNTLDLVIADDGVGIDPTRARGVGLLGIEERARELHGDFFVQPHPPHGTELHVTLPVAIPIKEATVASPAG